MKFSVIIPCHNVSSYLRETLNSVERQTLADYECICIDDGSTDDTGAILDEYAAKDSRIVVRHTVNAGVSAARNMALGIARGDYVCFLDGDDIWTSDWLQKMYDASDRGMVDIIRMDFTYWRENEKLPEFELGEKVTYINGGDNVLKWGWLTYTLHGFIWLNAIKRSLLRAFDIAFPMGMKINEDIIFNLSVLPYAKRVAQSSYAGYFYRMRSTSAWHSARPIEGCTRYLSEMIQLWETNMGELRKVGCDAQARKNITFMFYSAILQWLDFGVPDERGRKQEIAKLMHKAMVAEMLDYGAIPLYWRPAFAYLSHCESFALIIMTYRLLDVYHRVHAVLRRMILSR